jgi:hypothetical protein
LGMGSPKPICLIWPCASILPISGSQVPWIKDVRHWHPCNLSLMVDTHYQFEKAQFWAMDLNYSWEMQVNRLEFTDAIIISALPHGTEYNT